MSGRSVGDEIPHEPVLFVDGNHPRLDGLVRQAERDNYHLVARGSDAAAPLITIWPEPRGRLIA